MAYQRQGFAQATCPVLTTRRRSVPPKTDSSAPHLRQHLKWPRRHLTWRNILTAVNVLFFKKNFGLFVQAFQSPLGCVWSQVIQRYDQDTGTVHLVPCFVVQEKWSQMQDAWRRLWNHVVILSFPIMTAILVLLIDPHRSGLMFVDVLAVLFSGFVPSLAPTQSPSLSCAVMCPSSWWWFLMLVQRSVWCWIFLFFSFCFIICMLMHISNKFKEEELDVFVC